MRKSKSQLPPKPSTTPDCNQAPAAVAECQKHFTQEKKNSCVVASSRNIIKELTGKDVPESQLRNEMNTILNEPDHDWDKNPIDPANAIKLLDKHGVKAKKLPGNSVSNDDLATLTSKGKPVMIGFKNPGHRVVLDSVTTDEDGNKVYNVRDPARAYDGKMRNMTEDEFNKKRNPTAIVIVPE
jgi:uncharacterized protein YvpB